MNLVVFVRTHLPHIYRTEYHHKTIACTFMYFCKLHVLIDNTTPQHLLLAKVYAKRIVLFNWWETTSKQIQKQWSNRTFMQLKLRMISFPDLGTSEMLNHPFYFGVPSMSESPGQVTIGRGKWTVLEKQEAWRGEQRSKGQTPIAQAQCASLSLDVTKWKQPTMFVSMRYASCIIFWTLPPSCKSPKHG